MNRNGWLSESGNFALISVIKQGRLVPISLAKWQLVARQQKQQRGNRNNNNNQGDRGCKRGIAGEIGKHVAALK